MLASNARKLLTICGLALIGPHIDDGTISLPFAVSSGQWTEHAFQARFGPTRKFTTATQAPLNISL